MSHNSYHTYFLQEESTDISLRVLTHFCVKTSAQFGPKKSLHKKHQQYSDKFFEYTNFSSIFFMPTFVYIPIIHTTYIQPKPLTTCLTQFCFFTYSQVNYFWLIYFYSLLSIFTTPEQLLSIS